MMSDRKFPIITSYRAPKCINEIPWEFIESGRKQAYKNHGQTLERLAQRGGLSPGEVRCALTGKDLSFHQHSVKELTEDIVWMNDALKHWKESQ